MTTRKVMPAAVKHAIETVAGAPLGSRAARVIGCRHCAAPVFRGLDADLMALEVTADVRPLNAAGELAAILTDRRTYELRWVSRNGQGRYELERRDSFRIRGRPPGTAGIDVLAAHRCNTPLGATALTCRPPAVEQLPDHPPF